VTINDALPLKVARRDGIANLKSFYDHLYSPRMVNILTTTRNTKAAAAITFTVNGTGSAN